VFWVWLLICVLVAVESDLAKLTFRFNWQLYLLMLVICYTTSLFFAWRDYKGLSIAGDKVNLWRFQGKNPEAEALAERKMLKTQTYGRSLLSIVLFGLLAAGLVSVVSMIGYLIVLGVSIIAAWFVRFYVRKPWYVRAR
jgi:hypothetical protein